MRSKRSDWKKSVHVWLPITLVEKIKAENDKANAGSRYWRVETIQATYERILEEFFEAPKAPEAKKAVRRGMIKT
jgi:hypothetical protein